MPGTQNVDNPLVKMENPCPDCGQEWYMEQREVGWWKRKIEAGEIESFPKRCRPCRQRKQLQKQREGHVPISVQIRDTIKEMESDAEFAFDLEAVLKRLDEIATDCENIERIAREAREKRQKDNRTRRYDR